MPSDASLAYRVKRKRAIIINKNIVLRLNLFKGLTSFKSMGCYVKKSRTMHKLSHKEVGGIVLKSRLRNLSVLAGMSGEPAPGQTVIELFGDCRVLIENHIGIVAFNDAHVEVLVSCGCLRVTGAELCIALMTDRQVVITGRIYAVLLDKGAG